MFDRKARRLGLERAGIIAGNRVLEVGCGPGIAHRRPESAGGARASLVQADGSRLPFRDCSFDVLFSAYVLDLTTLGSIRAALVEFLRVLRPGGRLVLVSMTKKDEAERSWWEWLYIRLTPRAAAWVLGGCRPVLLSDPVAEAGFRDIQREMVKQFVPSEIVIARKPDP